MKKKIENYSVDHFIRKFENIAEDKWCRGALHKPELGQSCALGHCGGYETKEAVALQELFTKILKKSVPTINDIHIKEESPKSRKYLEQHSYTQNHPKKRILAALADIKKYLLSKINNVEEVKVLANTLKLNNTGLVEVENEEGEIEIKEVTI